MPIKINNISKKFYNNVIIKNFSIELPDIGRICFMGKNGIGKTVFLKILSGLLQPDEGSISGVDNKKISFVFQEDRLLPWLTIKENIKSVIAKNVKDKDALAIHWLDLIGLKDKSNCKPFEISGGMKRKVSIARALAFGGDIFLLDEPFKGLDDISKQHIINIIKSYTKNSLCILISHDLNEANNLCDNVYLLNNKELNFIN